MPDRRSIRGGGIVFSQVELQPSRARLVVDCKEAPEEAADLRDPACLAAVLGHLEREFGVESVVLSHYVEKQYGPKAMKILRGILGYARLLNQVGTRRPTPAFSGLSKKQTAAKCAPCPLRPRTLFAGLRERLLGHFATFHAAFTEAADRVDRHREPGCEACTATTENDLVYLFREFVAFGEATVALSSPEEARE